MRRPKLTEDRCRTLWISLALFAVAFGFFARVLLNDFVAFDDDQSVYQNPHVQGLDWGRLVWIFSDVSHAVRYKPLTWLSYGLIYEVNGLAPFGYHLANLLFHCLDTVLLFLVIRRLLAWARSRSQNGDSPPHLDLAAALGALLWAVNPLRVEPVARVTDLTYGQSLFFLLLSLWFYLPAPREEGVYRFRRVSYWCSVAAFALSMLSYPFAFGYVLVLVGLDWYPLRRLDWTTPWWREAAARRIAFQKLPFLLLGGLVGATFLARLNPVGDWTGLPSASDLNLIKQATKVPYVWIYYVWKPWLPFYLSPLYNALIWFKPLTWPFLSSALLVAGISLLLWRKRYQWPAALVLWVAHLSLFVAVLGLTERFHHTCDRYGYVPGIVWAVGVAAVLWRLLQRRSLRPMVTGLALGLSLLWGGLSVHQIRIWKNTETLFNYMLGQLSVPSPYRSVLYGYLGTFYAEHGRVGAAVQEYRTSLRVEPSVAGYYRLATLLETNGAVEGALTNYLKLLELRPDASVHARAAALLSNRGQTAEAIDHYRQALALSPDWAPALNNLAWLLATAPDAANRTGAEAVQLAERAVALTQSKAPVMLGTLAAAYAEAGRFTEAVAMGERACAVARAAGETELVQRNQQLLELYRAGKAYREPRSPSP
jgi:protein O-mannosyl-transferase